MAPQLAKPTPTRAVILAAGVGQRMGERTAAIPKPLVTLGGRPLIAYTIEALEAAGLQEVVVVTGYRGDQVPAALTGAVRTPLRFVTNPRYLQGASLSLAAARDLCGDEPFVLTMSDHLLGPDLIHALLVRAASTGVTVAADARPREPWFVDEATRLNVSGGVNGGSATVTAIGKRIYPWTHLDTGAFVCTPEIWPVLGRAPASASLSDVFSVFARRGALHAADVTGAFWFDVDTPEDFLAAERILAARSSVLA